MGYPLHFRARKKRSRRRFTRGQLTMHARPPRRGKEWRQARLAAETNFCEVPRCDAFLHEQLKDEVIRKHPPIDHIVPELLLFSLNLIHPHDRVNLICLCKACHGRKKTVEDRLFRGDKMGFLAGLRSAGPWNAWKQR